MASQVSIVNRALTKLGAERILLLEDNSKAARVMRAIYEDVCDAELSAYRWKFAMRRTRLAALDADHKGIDGFDYGYAYPLPHDYLSLVQLNEMDACVRGARKPLWSIEGNQLLTDFAPPLGIRYIARIRDCSAYSPLFVEVLACKLAIEACESLTQSNTKKQLMWQEYEQTMQRAIRQDAVEKAPDVLPVGNWLKARESQMDTLESFTALGIARMGGGRNG